MEPSKLSRDPYPWAEGEQVVADSTEVDTAAVSEKLDSAYDAALGRLAAAVSELCGHSVSTGETVQLTLLGVDWGVRHFDVPDEPSARTAFSEALGKFECSRMVFEGLREQAWERRARWRRDAVRVRSLRATSLPRSHRAPCMRRGGPSRSSRRVRTTRARSPGRPDDPEHPLGCRDAGHAGGSEQVAA